MKTTSKILVYLFLIFAAFGCKRENLITENNPEFKSITEKVKYWIKSKPEFDNQRKIQVARRVINVAEEIEWDESTYFAQSRTNITPVYVGERKNGRRCFRYLVAVFDASDNIDRAYYYDVLIKKKDEDFFTQSKITPELFNSKKIPNEFTGAIIQYDIANNKIVSKHYQNGVLSNEIDKIVAKKISPSNYTHNRNDITEPDNPPLPEGCSYVVIEWYWQVYVNGVLIYEEYLYTSISLICAPDPNGGGGGGNPPSPPTPLEICEIATNNILNSTSGANTLVSNIIQTQTNLERTRRYTWKCVQGLGWYVVCHDEGIQKRLSVIKPWQWYSLVNLSISKVGNTATYGGSVTATKVSVTPTMGVYFCYMHAIINIKATVSYLGFTWTNEREFNSTFTYRTDTAPDPGY